MIEGTLVINLEPPYMGFLPKPCGQPINAVGDLKNYTWHYCTQTQIKDLLVELGVISTGQLWPPRECILRLPVVLPMKSLTKHGLLNIHSLELTTSSNRLLRRIS